MTFRSLFRHRDFTVLWLAGAQSQIGDQLARVALSVLVFMQTGSGLATAATYALTYLPAVVGGILLAGLADRYARRPLIVACDVIRSGLFLAMAVPGEPIALICILLVLAVLAGTPYSAAEPAVVADIFDGDSYTAAIGLRTATVQAAQLVGFVLGGVVVAWTGARLALGIDAATFAASALLLRFGLQLRPALDGVTKRGLAQAAIGVRVVAHNVRLRQLVGLAWLAGFWIVPEGLAAPYSAEHGGGPAAVGVLLAANPVGNLIGVLVLTRWVSPAHRRPALSVLAIASGLPLIACATSPGIATAAVLWGVCGLLSANLVLIVSEFVLIVPPASRGQAIGLASSGLLAAQGFGLLAGGVLTSLWAVGPAIAVTGAVGSGCAIAMVWSGRKAVRHTRADQP